MHGLRTHPLPLPLWRDKALDTGEWAHVPSVRHLWLFSLLDAAATASEWNAHMIPPRCAQCRSDMALITLSTPAGEFARRWKCCRCGATANAGMVQSNLQTRPTLLGTYSTETNA